MNIRYAQDYVVGDIFDLGTFELSKDEIIEFQENTTLFHSMSMNKLQNKLFLKGLFQVVG